MQAGVQHRFGSDSPDVLRGAAKVEPHWRFFSNGTNSREFSFSKRHFGLPDQCVPGREVTGRRRQLCTVTPKDSQAGEAE
jgi:hypothetical protein